MPIHKLGIAAMALAVVFVLACSQSSSSDDPAPTCAPDGYSCASRVCCSTATCVSGTCVAKAADGQTCTNDGDCVSGSCGLDGGVEGGAGNVCVRPCTTRGAMKCGSADDVLICEGSVYRRVGGCPGCSDLSQQEFPDHALCKTSNFQTTAVAGYPCLGSTTGSGTPIGEVACNVDRTQALQCPAGGGVWTVTCTGGCRLFAAGSTGCPGTNECLGCN